MTAIQDDAIRRTILFGGTVQGVGFRYSTRMIASGFAVTGFVKNLPDGRVEVVAQGQRNVVDQFQAAVLERMSEYVTHSDCTDAPATAEFDGFTIRR